MTRHDTEPLTCPECKGSGDCPEQPWRPCPSCYGQGIQYVTKVTPLVRPAPVDDPPGRDLDGAA